ncbi:MAG: metallophosphoesterase [Candidatus Eisenbacteria bacterium]|nr:metallophosphoesterase [Candidatus Eisenbacteria bacterium]
MFHRPTPSITCFLAALLLLFGLPGLIASSASALPYTPPGDTLTVIMRPIQTVPTILVRGDTLDIDCAASSSTTDWTASLGFRQLSFPLEILSAQYVTSLSRWAIKALVSSDIPFELYDLTVTASGGILDTTRKAVNVIDAFDSSFYFIQVTDTHLPTHLYYYESGGETDTSEVVDLREVIKDVNLINPVFLVHTGDIINEGELEDYQYYRYFTRTQRLLTELEVPVYVLAGNHDVGGWDSTPPPAGEARRTWWRFFGWPYLNSPPTGVSHTQDYSFDYGTCHFVGLEGYINYDNWRPTIYGSQSFTSEQLSWLSSDLAKASGSQLQMLFYHMDFSSQLNLSSLGVDLALYGHTHADRGSLTGWPLNIGTKSACDGNRAYRFVRVNGSTITPKATFAAGSTGATLRISFSPANDGTNDHVSATIVNGFNEEFERAMVRFYMKYDGSSYSVTNGSLIQTVRSDSVVICYVGVDVPAASSVTVSVDAYTIAVEGEVPSALGATSCFPNPFQAATYIKFSLMKTATAEIAIFDVNGHLVKRLMRREFSAGTYTYPWDATDTKMRRVPAGVYLCRVEVDGKRATSKLLVMR